ncbi:MAG: CocE/NonD family hydrolase, partial [Candidatus Lokiarchaeota archaeon]|nr:CocE/NonD family hydrolase [Candidatus Lokiarchaeota archaeon]
LIAVGFAILSILYKFYRRNIFKLREYIDKHENERLSKMGKTGKIIKIVVLAILIIFPISIIIITGIYSPPEKETFMVKMNDEVGLATDVYFAPGSFGSPRPVILIRTPYGKNMMGEYYGLLYNTQDYHMVIQDCRGTFDSEGKDDFIIFMEAFKDGVDTIEWILDQSWCNGKIASVGASALCINEYFYAGMNPSGLVGQSLMIGTPDLYKTSIYQGGQLKQNLVIEWIKGVAPENYEYQLQTIIDHPKKDYLYNTTSLFMEIGPNFDNVSVPALHVGGWYDTFQQGTLDGYMGYDDNSNAQGKQLLIMTPTTHGMPEEGKCGQLTFPTTNYNGFDLYLDWEQKLLDYALLGKLIDWSGNRVAYYLMGDVDDNTVNANEYRFAKDWPVPHKNDTWYLNSTSSIGLVNNTQPSSNFNHSYKFDPRNPVPTVGGNNLMLDSGPYDQRGVESRDDVLLFTSSKLDQPYTIVGKLWAQLYMMSNSSNTDFTVKLCDVYPDGKSILIADGIINAARREGFNKTAPDLNLSGIQKVIIDLWSTAYQFNTGHRIRVSISSSNYPRFGINPNTGEEPKLYPYHYLERNIANNTILTGGSFNSSITLPRLI